MTHLSLTEFALIILAAVRLILDKDFRSLFKVPFNILLLMLKFILDRVKPLASMQNRFNKLCRQVNSDLLNGKGFYHDAKLNDASKPSPDADNLANLLLFPSSAEVGNHFVMMRLKTSQDYGLIISDFEANNQKILAHAIINNTVIKNERIMAILYQGVPCISLSGHLLLFIK